MSNSIQYTCDYVIYIYIDSLHEYICRYILYTFANVAQQNKKNRFELLARKVTDCNCTLDSVLNSFVCVRVCIYGHLLFSGCWF